MNLRAHCALLLVPALLATTGCDGHRVATVEREYDIGEVNELLLDQQSGDLVIHGEEGRESVKLIVELRSRRVSDRQDDAAKDSLRLGFNALDDNSGRILAGLDNPPNGYHLDVVALVPADSVLLVDDDSGDVLIENVAGLVLSDGSGDVAISDIAGDVLINDSSGDISVDHVGGDVEIDDRSGDIAVRNVGGDADVEDRSGDIAIINIEGMATVRDRSGDIAIVNAGDARVVSDTSGDVSIN